MGRRALALVCDVSRDGELEHAVEQARREFGKINVVIANAGFGVAGNLEKLKLEDYRRQFETNVFGVLRTVYATLEELKKTQGSLALLGSVSGYVSLPGSSAYGMSKFAVHALANSLKGELSAHGIAVTLIAPGFVESEIRMVDNFGKFREEAPDPVSAYLRVSTSRAAREILNAIVARKREAVITGHGKVIVFVQRHFPWILRFLMSLGLKGRPEPKTSVPS
jgi:short-subunit dehydrogenase